MDPATHLCDYCGKPWVYNAYDVHGMNVCVYSCAGITGHRPYTEGNHSACVICGDWLCIGSHGEGICGTSTTVTVAVPTTTAAPNTPVKSSDATLNILTATFPNGKRVDMRLVSARKNIVVTGQKSVTVMAVASDSRGAKVSGDTGELSLKEGENSFRVTVTAEDGSKANYNFTITVIGKEKAPATPIVAATVAPTTSTPTTSAPSSTVRQTTKAPTAIVTPTTVTPTTKATTAAPAHTHSYAYKYNDDAHWQECTASNCPAATERVAHTDDGNNDGFCDVCGGPFG